jgi:hypothetical protein
MRAVRSLDAVVTVFSWGAAAINTEKIEAFARPMSDELDTGDTTTRKGYIRSIIDAVEVDDGAIRIVGSKDVLQAAIAGKQAENGNVRGFVRKWRATTVSNTSRRARPTSSTPATISRISQISTQHCRPAPDR